MMYLKTVSVREGTNRIAVYEAADGFQAIYAGDDRFDELCEEAYPDRKQEIRAVAEYTDGGMDTFRVFLLHSTQAFLVNDQGKTISHI